MRDKKLDKLLEVVFKLLTLIKGELKDTKFDYYDYIYMSILKRQLYILFSIYQLIPRYKENSNLIIGLSPLLRMGLCDFISLGYILSSYKSEKLTQADKIEYEKRVEQILFSSLTKEIHKIEKNKAAGIISIEEYKIQISKAHSIAEVAFVHFNTETSEYQLKVKKDISPAKMFRKLSENRDFKKYHAAYDLYDYYSKMEHFGGFSNLINLIDAKDEKINVNRLVHSTVFISKSIELCIISLDLQDKENLFNKLQSIGKDFVDKPLNINWW